MLDLNMKSVHTVLNAVAMALALSACSSLTVEKTPSEFASAPANAPIWRSLETIRSDNWNILLNDGATALDWRLTAIDSATQSIDLQTFLWSMDEVGSAIRNRLLAAASRGVRIRLLVDDSFILGEDALLIDFAAHPNIDYRIFNPYARRSDNVVTREVLNLGDFGRLNHRMHNKVMLVDNRVAILGGRNLADEYFGLHDRANFRDMELLVGGAVVPGLSEIFDAYWNDIWSVPVDTVVSVNPEAKRPRADALTDGESSLRYRTLDQVELLRRWQTAVRGALSGTPEIVADVPPPQDILAKSSAPTQLADRLIDVLDSANEEVIIISAYLIPSPGLEQILERAAKRGVRIRILTNSIRSNNHITAHSAYRNHINQLMTNGAELHEVRIDALDRPRYMRAPVDEKVLALHAKAMIVDHDRIFIGSANLDPRSLRINTEVGLLVTSETLNAQVRSSVEPDLLEVNAWNLQFDESGNVIWVGNGQRLTEQPAASFMQRLEDWFFAHLPIEDQM